MSGMRHRPTRSPAVAVVAVVMILLGAGAGWLAIQRLSTGSWLPQVGQAADGMSSLAWASTIGWVVGVALAVLGLVLLLAAVVPGAYNAALLRLPREQSPGVRSRTEAVLGTPSLARLASAEASQVDGVGRVSSSAGARSVVVRITTPLRENQDVVGEVRKNVEQRLARTGVRPAPKVRVRARTKEVS